MRRLSVGPAGENEVPRVPPGRRLSVLLLAEVANPKWVSVPMVGWRHVEAVAQFADAHLVTHVRNRDDILGHGWPAERATFVGPTSLERYVDKVADALSGTGVVNGGTQTAFSVPAYLQFEHEAWTRLQARIEAGAFDLVHRVTPVSPGVPSSFAERTAKVDIPFVLGPVNGDVPWPKGFSSERRRAGEWLGVLRPMHRLLPYYRSLRQHASAILVGSATTYNEMPEAVRAKTFYVPENAVDPAQFVRTTAAHDAPRLRVAFVGKLVSCKGVEMLLRAAAPLIHADKLQIDVIGDGPERPFLQQIVRDQALQQGVRLDGWVAHDHLQERLLEASVFGFPSVRELAGGAIIEAMTMGLIPLVVGYGAPSEIVTDTCGIRVPLGSHDEIVAGLRSALERLVAMTPDERRALGEAARQRVIEAYSIATKRDKTERVYEWLVGRAAKPDLAPPAAAVLNANAMTE